MNQEQKAQLYGELLNKHTKLHNMINEIKGQNIELNHEQIEQIRRLERAQVQIMEEINRILS